MANTSLNAAQKTKSDEFYTLYSDIEQEITQYNPEIFRDKIVYCNCDDYRKSNFFKFFFDNFEQLGLKKLIATAFCEKSRGVVAEVSQDSKHYGRLKGDGDFRSDECIGYLKQADIVVTNPPFSLFREYVAQLIEYNKSFLIIGSKNAITYKEIFPLIKNNQMWLGPAFNRGNAFFKVPKDNLRDYANGVYDAESGLVKFRNVGWYTNLDFQARHEELILYKKYYGNEEEYPKYDNYDAINVDKTADIPCDYFEKMGVPITYLDKHNPEQFTLEDIIRSRINGKWIYRRLIIKRR